MIISLEPQCSLPTKWSRKIQVSAQHRDYWPSATLLNTKKMITYQRIQFNTNQIKYQGSKTQFLRIWKNTHIQD